MGWTSQLLRRLLVGFPYPTSTGLGLIVGPGPYLPPPLNTYLIVGMAWINAGTMNYWGIRFNTDPSVLEYVAEFGFVNAAGAITPQSFMFENGASVETWFTGDGDVEFRNTGGTYFDPGVGQPVGFVSGNVTFYDDTFIQFGGLASSPFWQMDSSAGTTDLIDWDMTFDATSTLVVPTLRSSTSGQDTGDYSFTNTSYGIGTSAGTYFSVDVVFTAPPSGCVDLDFRGQVLNSVATNQTYISPVVREGGTVGSGTVVLAASDARAMVSGITSANPGQSYVGAFCSVTGLTSGATYNVRLEHRVNAGTGRTLLGELRVSPQP